MNGKQIKGNFACIQINKNHSENLDWLKKLPYKYIIIGGFEDGGNHILDPVNNPENKHFHAFIDFGKRVGQTRYRKHISGQGDWVIPNYGTTDSCREYCIKLIKKEKIEIDGKKKEVEIEVKKPYGNIQIMFEDGEFCSLDIGQGSRNDLKKLIEENEYDPKQIREADLKTYARYRNGILDICNDYKEDKEMEDWLGLEETENGYVDKEYEPAVVHWYYGSTGTGKTYNAKKEIREAIKAGIKDIKKTSRIDKFANNFALGVIRDQTETLIVDEFRGSRMALADLLQLIDGTSINVKGGKKYIHAKEIFITSCQKPNEAYHSAGSDSVKQLLRRITDLRKFGEKEEKDYEEEIFGDETDATEYEFN